jgi:hypothetical protein
MSNKIFFKQIGGSHYKRFKISPAKFIMENDIPYAEGNVIKYICRHSFKGQELDLAKAKQYIDFIIETKYEKKTRTIRKHKS